jgi:hypothetical protein
MVLNDKRQLNALFVAVAAAMLAFVVTWWWH